MLWLELGGLSLILGGGGLCWFGRDGRGAEVGTSCDIQIDGRRGAGKPKLTWKKLTEKNCGEWKLMTVDPQEMSTLR